MLDLQACLNVAVQAAQAAGEVHLKHLGQVKQVRTKSSFADLVTEVDTQSELVIRQLILTAFPDHAILGEEEGYGAGPHGETGAEARWVVDPLDGTVNYAHGYPVFAVSIGLEWQGERVVGAVLDPTRRELFTAIEGEGAWLNGERIQVSRTPTLRTPALLSTGFPYDQTGRRHLTLLGKMLDMGLPVRRPGAAALDLCNVACGRMDGFWELGLKPWDLAAGTLIVQEAGGRVTDATGQANVYAEMVIATNGLLHDELLAALQGQES